MTMIFRNMALAASVAVLATPVALQAVEARDLGYIRGMDTREGERALRSRGFDRISTQRAGQSNISFWWDDDDCVRVDEYNGTVASLGDVADQECGRHSGSGGAANAGGYWGSANVNDLIGARARGAMREFERRGFRQVDNFTSGNTRYSIQWNGRTGQCLQATIADGRIYDIRDIGAHRNCGPSNGSDNSYTSPRITWYPRLVGAAAPGARAELLQAGFESVFIENGGQRNIFYNRSSGQCLLMLARARQVTSVQDIGSDRRCR